jgi:hypothetical protein
MKKPRKLVIEGAHYKWLVSEPEEDYQAVNVRVWYEGTLYIDQWWHPNWRPMGVTPSYLRWYIEEYRKGQKGLPARLGGNMVFKDPLSLNTVGIHEPLGKGI